MRANVYPVPDPELPFLGAHLTRTLDGEVLVGPSALMARARDAYKLATVRRPRPRPDARLARDLAPAGRATGGPGCASFTTPRAAARSSPRPRGWCPP